ncbi:hypothetical protein ACFWOT_17705 [Streptomyces sp. NPDC058440]|uniref:hypothetical protein n=1 Tax=Streptomyces sp. NPDC058440 TaxID=3346501 RepID=UPI0036622187
MPELPRKRLWVMVTALALLVTAAAAWWLLREPSAPYALRATPEVNVTLRPEESTYPEAKEVADEVELLVKVYVQRLQAGEPADLARIGAPWYTARERAAQGLISRYGAHAGEPVEAVVSDPVVPGLAAVELRFGDGQRQVVDLVRGNDVWWLELGNGDPVKP